MILVPHPATISALTGSKKHCARQFRQAHHHTAEKHDKMIAFTSQMAHIVSTPLSKPDREEHKGYSAGSYRT